MKNQKKTVLYILTAIILTITSTIGVMATPFNDVQNSPYKAAIEELADLKITLGVSDTEFGVNQNVTRQQMTLFMARLLTGNAITGLEAAENTTTFTDLTDPTYFKSISYCYENKLIVGRDDATFDPTGNVSVQEAITIAVRALGYSDLDYPDGYIATAKHFGLLANLENVNYTAPMTRGQIAQLLYNTLHNINLAGEYGKSLYDAKFSKNPKLGYFDINTLDELKANYKYSATKSYLGDGYDSYIVEDVTFMGYTGDIEYHFAKDAAAYIACEINFEFNIMGEKKLTSPVNQWIENPSNALTAAEAKELLDGINSRIAAFAKRPIEKYKSTYKTGANLADAPDDIYKAMVDNYTTLSVNYQERDGDKYLPTFWELGVSAKTIGKLDGCILDGTIKYQYCKLG